MAAQEALPAADRSQRATRRPGLWLTAALILAPIALADLWLWFVAGVLATDSWEQLQAYQSVRNPELWLLGASAVVIVGTALLAVVLRLARRSSRAVIASAGLSVAVSLAWLGTDLVVFLRYGR